MSSLSRRKFVTGVTGALAIAAAGSQIAQAATSGDRTAAAVDPYTQKFLDQYNRIKNSANGYFSPQGIPYHSVETLMVEAPDHGHETTSEAFSYWIWLEATYGRVTGDWTGFNNAWATAEKSIIPSHTDQPSNDSYNPSSPATYAPEWPDPSKYPSALDSSVAVGADPIANELKAAYGTSDIYAMHWLMDVDNKYGYGNTPGKGTEDGPTAAGPSFINSYQRGSQESVWETIPQPCTDLFKYGGPNGYLDLFVKDSSYAKQWKYTNAPDADARAIQAAYWAYKWASDQGNAAAVSDSVAKAAKMGDYLRYAMFDKYFKRIGNCTSPTSCPAGTGRGSQHYMLGWYYAWGGAEPGGGWAWRIGDGAAHHGYQNLLAAWALSTVPALTPKAATGQSDWSMSLGRQLEFITWLQSAEGAIAGGATNSWDGQYGTPPAGDSTFYGMAYDYEPVYHDPPSNNWFGMQAWGMERVAEYYYVTGDTKAKTVLDKWVAWVTPHITVGSGGSFQIPSTLNWSGQPDTWNPTSPGTNSGLHVSIVDFSSDVGVGAALVKALLYYASKSGSTSTATVAKNLLDAMAANADSKGITTPETRTDYSRFNDTVYVPSGWTGTMPNGDSIKTGSTFLSIRSWYKNDPDWPKVQAYLDGGAAPSMTYHRFWAQADIAMAFAVYGELFGTSGGGGTTDTQAPTAPSGLTVGGTTATSATLTWTASTDNVGVSGYLVFRNGTQVGTSLTTTFSDSGLAASTAYTYTVKARDAAGNTSAASNSVTATTSAGGSGGGAVTATYHVDNDWGNGFTATVTVTNNGTAPTSSWQVTWSWGGSQQVTNGWNATVTESGKAVTAQSAAFNSVVAAGSSTTFGFQATYTGTNSAPTLTCTAV
jgi:Glycosyl hydrolase family 48/Cellulose binding domain